MTDQSPILKLRLCGRGAGSLARCLRLSLVAGLAAASAGALAGASDPPRAHGPAPGQRPLAALHTPQKKVALDLPRATQVPVPAVPEVATGPRLRPHEIFGFAPWWTLGAASGYDLAHVTTVAYFSVDIAGDGSLVRTGEGWQGYESAALVDVIDRAHAAGDAVVLTVTCFDMPTLHQLVTDPAAAAQLSQQLIDAVQAKRMDGVNLDLEGTGSDDRDALSAFVGNVSGALHRADPYWQVTVDTYASSASSQGYFDVPRLAAVTDALFVMAYDMQDDSTPSPSAPFDGYSANDTDTVHDYTAVVPPSKVILGVPFYGMDWPVTSAQGKHAVGLPSPVTYDVIAAAGHPRYWDPTGSVAWTSYRDDSGQWRAAYYDDPQSLALKARLASAAGLRGVGIWALGMDGNDPAMIAALLGNAPSVKDILGPVLAIPPVVAAVSPQRTAASPAPHSSSPGSTQRPSPSQSSSPSPRPKPSPTPAPLPTAPPLPPPPPLP